MRVIARRTLREFWQRHADAELPLRAWYSQVTRAEWASPAAVKLEFPSVSILPGNRLVFNIKGNDYRLVVAAHYDFGKLYVRFIGTHDEYDRIDAAEI